MLKVLGLRNSLSLRCSKIENKVFNLSFVMQQLLHRFFSLAKCLDYRISEKYKWVKSLQILFVLVLACKVGSRVSRFVFYT